MLSIPVEGVFPAPPIPVDDLTGLVLSLEGAFLSLEELKLGAFSGLAVVEGTSEGPETGAFLTPA
jgi:hypothetical protein